MVNLINEDLDEKPDVFILEIMLETPDTWGIGFDF